MLQTKKLLGIVVAPAIILIYLIVYYSVNQVLSKFLAD
jgi:hypothetical protein